MVTLIAADGSRFAVPRSALSVSTLLSALAAARPAATEMMLAGLQACEVKILAQYLHLVTEPRLLRSVLEAYAPYPPTQVHQVLYRYCRIHTFYPPLADHLDALLAQQRRQTLFAPAELLHLLPAALGTAYTSYPRVLTALLHKALYQSQVVLPGQVLALIDTEGALRLSTDPLLAYPLPKKERIRTLHFGTELVVHGTSGRVWVWRAGSFTVLETPLLSDVSVNAQGELAGVTRDGKLWSAGAEKNSSLSLKQVNWVGTQLRLLTTTGQVYAYPDRLLSSPETEVQSLGGGYWLTSDYTLTGPQSICRWPHTLQLSEEYVLDLNGTLTNRRAKQMLANHVAAFLVTPTLLVLRLRDSGIQLLPR